MEEAGALNQAIRLDATLEQVEAARDFVGEMASKLALSPQAKHDLELVVTEALTNVVEHAYEFAENEAFELEVKAEEGSFTVLIRHDGKDFDPHQKADPVMQEYLAQRRVGGLGLYLIKKLMDEVEYGTDPEGRRVIRLVKRQAGPKA